MYRPKTTFLIAAIVCICTVSAFAAERKFKFEKKVLKYAREE
jgi:hypothetical protein